MNTDITNFKDIYHLRRYIDNGNIIHKPFTVCNGDRVFISLQEYKDYTLYEYGLDFDRLKPQIIDR